MPGARQSAKQGPRVSAIEFQLGSRLSSEGEKSMGYAVRADFCRIFETHMRSLYLLALVLTADRSLAEQCFVRGLSDTGKANRVFKDWAHLWARRMVIRNAIQMVWPSPAGSAASLSDRSDGRGLTERPEIAAIATLPGFERFVFVMSVLERYSNHDCALLLGRTRAEVAEGRIRALNLITKLPNLDREPLAGISAGS
jgi:hypothetical protein